MRSGSTCAIRGGNGAVHLEGLPALASIPAPPHLLAVLEHDAHVDREHAVSVAADDDGRAGTTVRVPLCLLLLSLSREASPGRAARQRSMP